MTNQLAVIDGSDITRCQFASDKCLLTSPPLLQNQLVRRLKISFHIATYVFLSIIVMLAMQKISRHLEPIGLVFWAISKTLTAHHFRYIHYANAAGQLYEQKDIKIGHFFHQSYSNMQHYLLLG